ncbi:MAG: hypothetical protein ABI921_00530 [Panacibacter sp.]
MKNFTFLLCLLTCISAKSQLYYGTAGGVKISKQQGQDLLISVPIGYAFNSNMLIETQLHSTLGGTIAPTLMAGYKLDITEHAGLHFLVGVADDLVIDPKQFKTYSKYYRTATVRLWMGQCMLQASTFNGSYFLGFGVIGFRNNEL